MSTPPRKRDANGRIIVPVDGPNVPGNPRRDIMRLGLVGGRRSDTDPTVAPISDVNNFVMLPDGSGMRVRDGFEFTQKFAIRTTPPGRIALMFDTAPANQDIGYRHMALPTATGTPFIYDGENIRDRSQALGDGAPIPTVFFPFSSVNFYIIPTIVTFEIQRTGPLDLPSTVKFRCIDGTAQSGVHYTAPVNKTLTFAADATTAESDDFTFMGSPLDKYFFIELYEPTNAKIGTYELASGMIRLDV